MKLDSPLDLWELHCPGGWAVDQVVERMKCWLPALQRTSESAEGEETWDTVCLSPPLSEAPLQACVGGHSSYHMTYSVT